MLENGWRRLGGAGTRRATRRHNGRGEEARFRERIIIREREREIAVRIRNKQSTRANAIVKKTTKTLPVGRFVARGGGGETSFLQSRGKSKETIVKKGQTEAKAASTSWKHEAENYIF